MKKNLIFRCAENNISGYKCIVEETFKILNSDYSLISLTSKGEKNKDFKTCFYLNKENFFSDELFISPLEFNRDNSWDYILPDKDNINILTMWESTLLPKINVKELNNTAKKVFVPCLWNKESFEFCGVKNVELLNLFVNDEVYSYKEKNNLNIFTFFCGANLSSFTSSNARKNIDVVIECFLKVFKNIKDVELVVKNTSMGKNCIFPYLNQNVRFIDRFLKPDDMRNLYVESDVFVSLSKSEGWGFFQIESLAVGRPVITANYGGIKEFCNSKNSFFLDYKEELATGYWAKSGGLWAEIDKNSLCEVMYWCYKNKDFIRNNWLNYSQSVLPKFNLSNYKNRLISSL